MNVEQKILTSCALGLAALHEPSHTVAGRSVARSMSRASGLRSFRKPKAMQ